MNELPGSSYYLPRGTELVLNRQAAHCKNLALLLDKYIKREVIDNTKNKGPWLRECIKNGGFDADLARSVYARRQAMMRALDVTPFDMTLAWRLIVGLGGGTVLETDITLHHLYGFPIIPGSALKGLTRAYVAGEEEQYFVPGDKPEAELGPSRDVENDHPDLKRVFGTQKEAGSVLFFDALPREGQAKIVVDLINPHYPDYNTSMASKTITPPTNDQAPWPVPFLTVGEETTFTFALAPRDKHDAKHRADVTLAVGWLQKALCAYGVGGKTSAGYGYFSLPSQQEAKEPAPYIRPNIPKFAAGAVLSGTVVSPTDDLRRIAPDARAFLRFLDWPTSMVLVIVEAEEAASWSAGQARNCVFVREEERERCTVLICQPGEERKKKKNKKK